MRDPNLSRLIAAADPRATLDVDAIAEITSYVQYAEFGERLQ